jgi:hypothetical protein
MALIDQPPHESRGEQARPRLPAVTGEYCCGVCGYRILGSGDLPTCPMCRQQTWRLVAWRPFGRPELPAASARRSDMHIADHNPKPGDVIEVEGRVGTPGRSGEIREVLGEVGHAHFRVRWDDGRESIYYPSSDARVRVGPES